jgi:hypothetical protein
MADSTSTEISFWHPLRNRNFRLLFIGEGVSAFGDQFYLVALPWLTLQLTGSPLDLGGVLTAVAIPRAILMLVGGALSDRFSPRWIMVATNTLRGGLTALLAFLALSQTVELWQLYLFAISFGIVEGFFTPAAEAIVPTLVPQEMLMASNVLGQAAMQLIALIGPALAGAAIAYFGIGIAFVVDASSFAISTLALLSIRLHRLGQSLEPILLVEPTLNDKIKGVTAGISEGLNYCWHHRSLRAVLIVLTAINFLFIGPLQVGINTLTYERFAADPAALGIMMSAWGAGGLLGTLAPQWLPRLPGLGILMLGLASIQAVGIISLSIIPTVAIASLAIAMMGWCSSFFIVVATTWIQTITPPEILGRVMSVAMLSSLGIAPLSYAVAGMAANISLGWLFGGSGGLMLAVIGFLAMKFSILAIN